MKNLFFMVPLCVFVCSCVIPTSLVDTQGGVTYSQSSEDQKVFSFGNKKSDKNVLIVLGSDIYKERFVSIGNSTVESKILSYTVNAKLYNYYPDDPDSTLFDSKFSHGERPDWIDDLDLNNAFYYVIVTNQEENVFPLVKSSGLAFDYFWMYFHGSRNDFDSRALYRTDLLLNLNDSDIKKSFKEDCFALILSCNFDSYHVSSYSFAVLLSYYTGIGNMTASACKVFDSMDENRIYYGDFRKVSYDDDEIQNIYRQYQTLVSVRSSNSLRGEHLVVSLPIVSVVSSDAANLLSNEYFYSVYSTYDSYYQTNNETSQCEVYLNYKDKQVIWRYVYKVDDVVTKSVCYQISSDYFGLFLLIFDVYGNGTVSYKYVDLEFL